MKKQLIKLANHLDKIGFVKEADYVDALLKRYAEDESNEPAYTIPDEIILDDGIFNDEEAKMLKELSEEALSEELNEPDGHRDGRYFDEEGDEMVIPPEPEVGGNPRFLGIE